jgi:hypothetical protein
MKTSELTGAALDWAVAKCEGLTYWDDDRLCFANEPHGEDFEPSTDWAQGGAIIEREGIDLKRVTEALWDAHAHNVNFYESGSTPLEAAMRCYVASKLGEDVDVPQEIMQ